MRKFIHLGTFRNAPIFVHWSVPAVCLFLLGAGLQRIFMVAVGLAAYLSILLVHEIGHHLAAVRRGYHVDRIDIFLFHATCRFEAPEYQRDAAVIALSGPLAQLLLALPFTAIVVTYGFTPFQAANAMLAILGYFNPFIAFVNLVPIAPLDGKLAWTLLRVPSMWRNHRRRPEKSALDVFEEARQKAIRKAKNG